MIGSFNPVQFLPLTLVTSNLIIQGSVRTRLQRLMDVMNDLTFTDMTMGVMTILLALEAARRTIGLSLPIMAVISLSFYIWGNTLIGGNWQPPRVSTETVI